MQWTLSPWALLGGRVSAHVRIDGPGVKLKTDVVRQADGSVRLSGLTGEAEAGWLGPALAIPALEPTGTLLLDAPAVEFDRAQLPRQVDAKIIWQNAGVRGQAVARLVRRLPSPAAATAMCAWMSVMPATAICRFRQCHAGR